MGKPSTGVTQGGTGPRPLPRCPLVLRAGGHALPFSSGPEPQRKMENGCGVRGATQWLVARAPAQAQAGLTWQRSRRPPTASLAPCVQVVLLPRLVEARPGHPACHGHTLPCPARGLPAPRPARGWWAPRMRMAPSGGLRGAGRAAPSSVAVGSAHLQGGGGGTVRIEFALL